MKKNIFKYVALSAIALIGFVACEKKDDVSFTNSASEVESVSPIKDVKVLRRAAAPQLAKAQKIGKDFSQMTKSTLLTISSDKRIIDKNTNGLRADVSMDEWELYSKEAIVDWIQKSEYQIDINQIPEMISLEQLKAQNIYTSGQIGVVQELIDLSEAGLLMNNFEEYISNIEDEILQLSEEEREELFAITAVLKGSYQVIFSDNPDFEISELRIRMETFMCNLAAGGIATIYGSVAAGIAAGIGVATGGVSVVVSLVVGAAMSTIFC